MAATFHVYVDGAVDATPDGLNKLATAMASRYGLKASDLVARLGKGRFRVKASVDQATADTYLRDLRAIGARCVIEPADPTSAPAPAPPARPTPLPPPATPRPATSSLPAPLSSPATPRPATSSLPPQPRASTPPPVGGYQSGLSAAFSGEAPEASLGALSGDLSSFSLGSVDGVDDQLAPTVFEVAPAPPPKPAAPAKSAKPAKAAKPKDEPLDLFAPPESQGDAAEFKVDLAPEEEERAARKRVSTPPSVVVEAMPAPAETRGKTKSIDPPTASIAPPAARAAPMDRTIIKLRARFAAGVVLAILVGFLPAHLIASARERSAFKAIDDKVELAQTQADTPDAYAALDRLRDEQLARKASDRRSIAMLSVVIWAIVGSGLAYVWFRRIPWDR